MPIFGVDVSHHQGSKLDWGKIRGSGVDFMFARASLATTPDEEYRGNVKRARAAGIPVLGAYHFLYPATVVSPAEQARLFVQRTGDVTGLMTMLDIERDNHHKPHIPAVRQFAEEFAHLTHGHPLLLYAPAWYWGIIGDPAASDLGALVASRYVNVDRRNHHGVRMTPEDAFARVRKRYWHATHGGWTHATILQFTSFGKVKGHPGRIDVNAFRGTVDELARLATPGAVPPAPPDDGPDIDPPDIDDDEPDEGIGHGSSFAAPVHAKRFHTVVTGDTLFAIAIAAKIKPKAGKQAFEVMIDKFPENAPFRAHPEAIVPGDRVRIR